MPFSAAERAFVASARVGHLATADAEGRPHVVALCYAFVEDVIVSPLDAKPKRVGPTKLKRVRNVRENPAASLLVDHYEEDWDALGWVRVDGEARVLEPDEPRHAPAVDALGRKYDQYADHPLEERPAIEIEPERAQSWGAIEPPG